jgi:L-threonylcarbamoyladenylate synthase
MARQQPRILSARCNPEESAIAEAARVLRQGDLVVLPTDTVYGVAADPAVPGAEERLYLAKARRRDKPIPLLVSDVSRAEAFGAVLSETERRLARQFWPGALTLVLRVRAEGKDRHDGPARYEGFRVPDHPVTTAVLREVSGVLRVTSANRSGAPPAMTARHAAAALGVSVALVLDAGGLPIAQPSTVARVEDDRIVVLREGEISASELKRAARG